MTSPSRDVWITGIGIVSCLGEGADAHWNALHQPAPLPDQSYQSPYFIHRLAPLNFDKQIPKKGDQRQMEAWQRTGTYAAGLALDDAGLKGKAHLLASTDMIVAAGGGERDIAVDSAIMTGIRDAASPDLFLNERLMSDLRPTLFLSQLSNLLAGNISIVHGVTGSSRTFMGEESAGFDAVRIARSRIVAGQSDIVLVGGSFNSERPDLLMLAEFAGFPLKDRFAPVWERGPKGGFALASLGAFLVLEARDHAVSRGAIPVAGLAAAVSDRGRRRTVQDITTTLDRLWDEAGGSASHGDAAILSGATGAEPATGGERAFIEQHNGLAVRATGSYLGHGVEPQFVMNIALAALAVKQGRLFPPLDQSGFERPMDAPLHEVFVTGVGYWRGEGIARVTSAG